MSEHDLSRDSTAMAPPEGQTRLKKGKDAANEQQSQSQHQEVHPPLPEDPEDVEGVAIDKEGGISASKVPMPAATLAPVSTSTSTTATATATAKAEKASRKKSSHDSHESHDKDRKKDKGSAPGNAKANCHSTSLSKGQCQSSTTTTSSSGELLLGQGQVVKENGNEHGTSTQEAAPAAPATVQSLETRGSYSNARDGQKEEQEAVPEPEPAVVMEAQPAQLLETQETSTSAVASMPRDQTKPEPHLKADSQSLEVCVAPEEEVPLAEQHEKVDAGRDLLSPSAAKGPQACVDGTSGSTSSSSSMHVGTVQVEEVGYNASQRVGGSPTRPTMHQDPGSHMQHGGQPAEGLHPVGAPHMPLQGALPHPNLLPMQRHPYHPLQQQQQQQQQYPGRHQEAPMFLPPSGGAGHTGVPALPQPYPPQPGHYPPMAHTQNSHGPHKPGQQQSSPANPPVSHEQGPQSVQGQDQAQAPDKSPAPAPNQAQPQQPQHNANPGYHNRSSPITMPPQAQGGAGAYGQHMHTQMQMQPYMMPPVYPGGPQPYMGPPGGMFPGHLGVGVYGGYMNPYQPQHHLVSPSGHHMPPTVYGPGQGQGHGIIPVPVPVPVPGQYQGGPGPQYQHPPYQHHHHPYRQQQHQHHHQQQQQQQQQQQRNWGTPDQQRCLWTALLFKPLCCLVVLVVI
ncbi:unnamed protein product [Chrysoparadoxa australica]